MDRFLLFVAGVRSSLIHRLNDSISRFERRAKSLVLYVHPIPLSSYNETRPAHAMFPCRLIHDIEGQGSRTLGILYIIVVSDNPKQVYLHSIVIIIFCPSIDKSHDFLVAQSEQMLIENWVSTTVRVKERSIKVSICKQIGRRRDGIATI